MHIVCKVFNAYSYMLCSFLSILLITLPDWLPRLERERERERERRERERERERERRERAYLCAIDYSQCCGFYSEGFPFPFRAKDRLCQLIVEFPPCGIIIRHITHREKINNMT